MTCARAGEANYTIEMTPQSGGDALTKLWNTRSDSGKNVCVGWAFLFSPVLLIRVFVRAVQGLQYPKGVA